MHRFQRASAITASTDSDGDGLTDITEIQTYGTDPNDSDSDDDGLSDGYEVMNIYDGLLAVLILTQPPLMQIIAVAMWQQ